MTNISKIKITKRTLLWHPRNDMVCNWYYLVFGRIYNADGTRYRKFRLISFFDNEDIGCYYDPDNEDDNFRIQDWQIREYIDINIDPILDLATDYNNLSEFYEACNQTIYDYNRTINS